MNILERWESFSRAARNFFLLFILDTVLFIGAMLKLPLLTSLWHEVFVDPLPDFYDLVVRQFIALIRDMSPSAVAVSGNFLSYVTGYATLLSIHLVVGYGIGHLFDQLSKSRWWSVTCYAVTVLFLVVMHIFVAYRMQWLL